jgi:Tfp pilus assembly protein PilW
MTLVELLVAFGVFLILVGLLVSLSMTGLETWQEGEARKDSFDRGRLVLDQISDDLRSTFADTEWHMLDGAAWSTPGSTATPRARASACGSSAWATRT